MLQETLKELKELKWIFLSIIIILVFEVLKSCFDFIVLNTETLNVVIVFVEELLEEQEP